MYWRAKVYREPKLNKGFDYYIAYFEAEDEMAADRKIQQHALETFSTYSISLSQLPGTNIILK